MSLYKGIRLVPQGSKWVVQRLGKYHGSLNPGLNMIVPYIDDVSVKITARDLGLERTSQDVIPLAQVVIYADAEAYINIVRHQ